MNSEYFPHFSTSLFPFSSSNPFNAVSENRAHTIRPDRSQHNEIRFENTGYTHKKWACLEYGIILLQNNFWNILIKAGGGCWYVNQSTSHHMSFIFSHERTPPLHTNTHIEIEIESYMVKTSCPYVIHHTSPYMLHIARLEPLWMYPHAQWYTAHGISL